MENSFQFVVRVEVQLEVVTGCLTGAQYETCKREIAKNVAFGNRPVDTIQAQELDPSMPPKTLLSYVAERVVEETNV